MTTRKDLKIVESELAEPVVPATDRPVVSGPSGPQSDRRATRRCERLGSALSVISVSTR